MHLRVDPVDFRRWFSAAPFYKLAVFVLITIFSTFIFFVAHIIEGLIWFRNRWGAIERSVAIWSGFVPEVMDPIDVPGDVFVARAIVDLAHVCVFCLEESEESIRCHSRCWKEAIAREREDPGDVEEPPPPVLP